MNLDLMDSWPRPLRTAVNSAGYRVVRWLAARELLQARFAKGRLPQELAAFLARWLATAPPCARITDRLHLDVQTLKDAELRILGGEDGLSGVPMERALLHLPALRAFWRQELRQEHYQALLASVPPAWLQESSPLPQGSVIHGLNITTWERLPPPTPGARWLMEKGVAWQPMMTPPASRFTACYERDDKGRVRLRSIEASS